MVVGVKPVKDRLARIGLLVPSVRRLMQQRRFGDAARTLQMLSLHSRLNNQARDELPKLLKRLRTMEFKETGSRVLSRYVPSLNQIRKDLETTDFELRRRVGTVLARQRNRGTAPSKKPQGDRLRRLPRLFRATRKESPKPVTPKPVPTKPPKPAIAPEVYRRISNYEGLPRNRPPGRVYKNTHGLNTLGRGHLVVPGTVRILKRLFGDKYPAEAVVQGKHDMTMAEVDRLFQYDVNKRVDEVRNAFPEFDRWPVYLQQEIMQAKYRGDLGPKTIGLIRSGQWDKASEEIKRVRDYKHPGIRPRVDAVSTALKRYGKDPVLIDRPPNKPKTPPTPPKTKSKAEKVVQFAKNNPVDAKTRLKAAASAAKVLGNALVREGGPYLKRKRMEMDPQLRRLQARIQKQMEGLDRSIRSQAKRAREETIPRAMARTRAAAETTRKRLGVTAQEMKKRSERGRNAATRALKTFQGKVAKRVAEGPRRTIQRPRR